MGGKKNGPLSRWFKTNLYIQGSGKSCSKDTCQILLNLAFGDLDLMSETFIRLIFMIKEQFRNSERTLVKRKLPQRKKP